MSGTGPTPVFLDTSAFYARADEDDKHHEDAIHLRLFSPNLRRWHSTNSGMIRPPEH